MAALSLTACGVTLGPKVADHHHMIERTTKTGRSAEIVQLRDAWFGLVLFQAEDGTVSESKMILPAGAKLMRPDIARGEGLISVRIAYEQEVWVFTEDKKLALLQIVGWYAWGYEPKDKPVMPVGKTFGEIEKEVKGQ